MPFFTTRPTNKINPMKLDTLNGTFVRPMTASGALHGLSFGEMAHQVRFTSLTGSLKWERATTTPGVTANPAQNPGVVVRAMGPTWSAHVPHQGRIYIECNGSGASILPPRWFDLATRRFVYGTGLTRVNDPDTPDCGVMFNVDWRRILVHADVSSGKLRLRYMNVDVEQPSWVNAPRSLSQPIPVPGIICSPVRSATGKRISAVIVVVTVMR